MKAIYPGSFDPLTMGHYDLVERASKMCEKLYVTISNNGSKSPLFSVAERLEMAREALQHFDNVEVTEFSGLLASYTKTMDINYVLRGLRAVSDFEYEFQMALMNRRLNKELDTIFLIPSQEYIFLSSSTIKDVAKHGGDITTFVPDCVVPKLLAKFNRAQLPKA